MASATFRVPTILRDFPRAVELSVIEAQNVVGAGVEAKAIRDAPAHMGVLRQSLKWVVTVQPGRVLGRLVAVNPQAAVYADVMDKGRRPGARGPGAQHLRRWVELKMPNAVRGLAAEIAARRTAALAKRTAAAAKSGKAAKPAPPKKSPTVQALDSLSFLVARAVHRKGIKGRHYAPPVAVVGREMVRQIGREMGRRVAAARELGSGTP